MLSLIRPKKLSTYGIHDPVGLRYLFQLRVSLSPLRNHKMQHNFADIRSDICPCEEGVEDTRHFLLFRPYYATQRVLMRSYGGTIYPLLKIS